MVLVKLIYGIGHLSAFNLLSFQVAPWYDASHYCTVSFEKVWTLSLFKSCSHGRIGDVLEVCNGEKLRQWFLLETTLNTFRRSTILQKQFIINTSTLFKIPSICLANFSFLSVLSDYHKKSFSSSTSYFHDDFFLFLSLKCIWDLSQLALIFLSVRQIAFEQPP